MADKKISQLTAASTPLAGTEVLPIVQSGSTVKATISNVLAPIQVTTTRAGINTAPTFSFHVLGSGEFGGMLAQSNVAGATSFTVQQGVTGVSNSGVTIRNADSAYDWLRFTATGGDVTAQTGNIVIGTAGKGIDFSANGGDVLTQYDEGTWNVNWNNLTGTPTSTVGRYTRIGRMVFFSYNTGAGAISGVGNNASFSLPFTPAYASVGTMIASNVTSAGNILIWTGSLAYPETFSGSEMVFSGMFYV